MSSKFSSNQASKSDDSDKYTTPASKNKTLHSYLDHPSVDTTCRFAVDRLIRSLGFLIQSRPRKGATIWLGPDKRKYSHQEVLKKLTKSSKTLLEDAKYAEVLYLSMRYPEPDPELFPEASGTSELKTDLGVYLQAQADKENKTKKENKI